MTAAFAVLGRDEFTGKQFGRFEVLCKLGEGGMSQVFLAWQKSVAGFRRPVVLKRILESIKHDEEYLRMFVQEAKITSALSHGNIAQLHDLQHEERELFMVMEFVPGATLVEIAQACAAAKEAIPIGLTTAVVRETALALHYAHTFKEPSGRPRPVIHRDIAEKNIMLSFEGATKLLDFGIARQEGRPGQTMVGMVKGTAGYMSPEQVKGEQVDGRSDLFSLGVVMHECLTGQVLFRRPGDREAEINGLLHAPIPAPSQRNRNVSIELDAVVMKALSRSREHRFANAKEMAEAVERAAGAGLWAPERRATFLQERFGARQQALQQLLGDPAKTDLGELLDDVPTVPPPMRDGLRTVNLRKVTPQPFESGAATLGETMGDAQTMAVSADAEDRTMMVDPPARQPRERRERPAPANRLAQLGLNPMSLGIAGLGAVILAVLLMLLLSRH